jgi:hypothetical protein
MNFRLYLPLLLIIPLICFAACAKQEKAVLDLKLDEKVVEVKRDEVSIGEGGKEVVTAQRASQTAPQKMSDNSEVTVMFDGFGNKLEKRYFKEHPRVNSVLIRTSVNGRREILVYGQNGEKTAIDGELSNRLLTASADEIADAAKIYETRSIYRTRKLTPVEQPKPEPPIVTIPPQTVEPPPDEPTTVEEPAQQTPENKDSNENPPPKEPQQEPKKDTGENK